MVNIYTFSFNKTLYLQYSIYIHILFTEYSAYLHKYINIINSIHFKVSKKAMYITLIIQKCTTTIKI